MDKKRFMFLVEKCLFEIDKEEYPEAYRILKWTFDDEYDEFKDDDDDDDGFYARRSMYSVACDLHSSDETNVMPPLVAHLVTEIYLYEIEKENYDAATNLGSLYYTGRAGEQDFVQAVKYYEIAAEHGERAAQENLGYCYYYGRTGIVDYEKAFNYFAMGAFDGHLRSLYKIADMYRNGYYVKKNEREAFIIYKHCYDTGTEKSDSIVGADVAMRLGDCYFEGIGVDIDYQKAMEYYQEAERKFYKRLMTGDFLMKNGYKKSIRRQGEVREKLMEMLPGYEWTKFHE